MNENTFRKGLAVLFATHPQLKPTGEHKDFVYKTWAAMFKDMPDQEFLDTITRFVMETPKLYPGDNWVAMVRQLASPTLPETEGDCIELAFEAVSRFGYMRESEATDWLQTKSPLIAACVQRIGFQMICKSEEPDVIRGQLRAIFKTEKERSKQFGGVVSTAQDFIAGQPQHDRLLSLVGKIGKALPEPTKTRRAA